jgi:ribosomal protein S18 acetylase RimI-like enzyme
MAETMILTNKGELESYLLAYPFINNYHLGDLDDFFWPHTRWYAQKREEEISAVALLYTGEQPPVLLALLNQNQTQMAALLRSILDELPDEVYTHLSPGLEEIFQTRYTPKHHGEHYKMALTVPNALEKFDTSTVFQLTQADLPRLEGLYAAAYPDNWFNPRMLETGQYVGISDEQGNLLCVAGVHVYSPNYRVATLGNITTLPEHRGLGLASTATAGLCKQLKQSVDVIGLNVRTNNTTALHAYQKVGFEVVAVYHEWMMEQS